MRIMSIEYLTSMIRVVDRHSSSEQLKNHSIQSTAHRTDQDHRTVRATPLSRLTICDIYI